MTYVIEHAISDGCIAVDFLESDLPLVVTFFAVHRHHRVQCCAVGKPELACIFNGFIQLLVTVQTQVLRHLRLRRSEVERQKVGFGIPVGRTAVLLAGEPFRTDVQSIVHTREGLVHMEDVEADALLCFRVAVYLNIRGYPFVVPGGYVLTTQCLIALCRRGCSARCCLSVQACHVVVHAG